MGLFNRYDGPYSGLESSFSEWSDKYCNPKDYSVSEDECRQYLEDLERGKKLNDEWNRERISRLIKTSYSIGFILTFSILFLVWYWLYKTDSAWAYPIALVTSWVVLGLSVWFFNKVSEYFNNQGNVYLSKFYPKVNENIEKLFEDYLWKCKLLDDARKKGEQEWKLTHTKVERMSHPDLDLFKETIEEKFMKPSEKNVRFNISLKDGKQKEYI